MSTSTAKLFEEKIRTQGELRWLSAFAVFGSLLALPGLLAVTRNLDLDADPRQAGSGFFAFNLGFLFASAFSSSVLRRLGIRSLAVAGLSLAAASLSALSLEAPSISFWWELLSLTGTGMAAGAISIASLFALRPWSNRFGALALPRLTELSGLGCIFSCVVAGTAYPFGRGRLAPVLIAGGVLFCLILCVAGRQPLVVVKKVSTRLDPGTRQVRSIASFLLLCLLFVQLGSEWSVAAWLPLFLIHRTGSGPSAAIFILGLYFLALLSGRALARRLAAKFSARTVTICGAILALAGCLSLSLSSSVGGILLALIALAAGFAPPHSIAKNILEERLNFAPAFYRAILSVAVTGAMCSAWLLGYVQQAFGMPAVALFPAAGSAVVLILELLLMFESHLMGERTTAQSHLPAVDRRMP